MILGINLVQQVLNEHIDRIGLFHDEVIQAGFHTTNRDLRITEMREPHNQRALCALIVSELSNEFIRFNVLQIHLRDDHVGQVTPRDDLRQEQKADQVGGTQINVSGDLVIQTNDLNTIKRQALQASGLVATRNNRRG